jgi:gas vesicle protein
MQNDQRHLTKRRDDSEVSAKIAYLVVGGTIGAALALLFAPKSGRELRGDIADVTRKGAERTRDAASQIGTRAGELYGVAATKAGEISDAARELAARKGEHVTAAIEAGRQAYAEEKQRASSDNTPRALESGQQS